MFESGFTGTWLYLEGKWARVIDDHEPDTDCDVAGFRDRMPVADCPTGAGLAGLLAEVSDGQVPVAEVLDRIVGFERLTAWAAAGQAKALAELVTRRTATDPNELPYAVEEVTLALSCSRMVAGTKVTTALDLTERLPGVLAALEQGRICPARARVFSDATRHLSAQDAAFTEQILLGQAETLSPARLKVALTALADSLDPREIEDRHADAAETRRVIKTPQEDGMASIWALLPADQAALVWAAINARAEHGRPIGPGGSAGPDSDPTQPEPTDARTADQRRADALTDVATLFLQGATNLDPVTGDVGQPPRVPGWAQVQVKLSAELLLGTSTEPAHLRGHGPIPTSMAVRIAADAQWQRIVYDPMTGALLDVATSRHDPPPALREFVLARLIPSQRCGLRTVRDRRFHQESELCARPDLHLGQLRPTPRRPRPCHPLPRRADRRAQPRRQMPTPPSHQTTVELPHRPP